MANLKYGESLTVEQFVEAITEQPDRAARALFAAAILGKDSHQGARGLGDATFGARQAGVRTH